MDCFLLSIRVVDIVDMDKADKGLFEQGASGGTKQRRCSEIGILDEPFGAQGQIAHRGHFKQIEQPCSGRLEFFLHPAQFLVLYLQLNLVHIEFVQQLTHLLCRRRALIAPPLQGEYFAEAFCLTSKLVFGCDLGFLFRHSVLCNSKRG